MSRAKEIIETFSIPPDTFKTGLKRLIDSVEAQLDRIFDKVSDEPYVHDKKVLSEVEEVYKSLQKFTKYCAKQGWL